MKLKIEHVGLKSPYLQQVKNLGKRHSRTLGFFPEGAFEEHARKGNVLAAIDEEGEFAGYVLFRSVHRHFSIPKAVIVHLAVEENFRGKGVAAFLVSKLHDQLKDTHLRIELACRQDYAENGAWSRLGFQKIGERPGRSVDGVLLDMWVIQLQDLPLFKLLEEMESRTQIGAVLDVNVLFRLQDDLSQLSGNDRLLAEEAKALDMDWLEDEVHFLITPELEIEITRHSDQMTRHRRRLFAKQFSVIGSKPEEIDGIITTLSEVFPAQTSESDRSDLQQIAHAISGNAQFFITDDRGLLKKSEQIFERFGIRLMSPGEFIVSIDEAIREQEYFPERLASSSIRIARLKATELQDLYSVLKCNSTSERIGEFETKIRNYLSNPHIHDVLSIRRGTNKVIGIWVHQKKETNILTVPMYRVISSRLTPTIKRYMIQKSVAESVAGGFMVTEFIEDCPDSETENALVELGFARVDGSWLKFNVDYCGPYEQVRARLLKQTEDIGQQVKPLVEAVLDPAIDIGDRFSLAEIEKRLWPVKIIDFPIPTFVVPIKPQWAQELFDERLASQTLFEPSVELILKNENVYYRHARNSGNISAPARILWYITKGDGYQGTMRIRACSYLDEVVVDSPKALYKRFQRLGVYEWNNVNDLTQGDLTLNIMALRFSRTQLFSKPISLNDYRAILLTADGKGPVLQSPQQISGKAFFAIYKSATDTDTSYN